jgi:hypothetical protein
MLRLYTAFSFKTPLTDTIAHLHYFMSFIKGIGEQTGGMGEHLQTWGNIGELSFCYEFDM